MSNNSYDDDFVVKEEAGQYQLPSEGNQYARCYMLIMLGTITNEKYNKVQKRVLMGWELEETLEVNGEEKRFALYKEYALSFNLNSANEPSNLRRDIVAWRGKQLTDEEAKNGVNLRDYVGKYCQVGVVHNTKDKKTYANIGTILALPKNVQKPFEPSNPNLIFSIREIGTDKYNGLNEWVRKKIEKSDEYKAYKFDEVAQEADVAIQAETGDGEPTAVEMEEMGYTLQDKPVEPLEDRIRKVERKFKDLGLKTQVEMCRGIAARLKFPSVQSVESVCQNIEMYNKLMGLLTKELPI